MKEFEHIIFIDIETVAGTDDYSTLDERFRTQWEKKAARIEGDEADTAETLYHKKAGIFSEFGKVVAISMGYLAAASSGSGYELRIKSLSNTDEKSLLVEFIDILAKFSQRHNPAFCAHNGKEFDYPYLSRRILINRLPLPEPLRISGKKPWEIIHLDTLELWKFGDYKNYTSLDLLGAVFNIPSSKDQIDGSQVNHYYYHEKDGLATIARYCSEDVAATAQVYLAMQGQDPIPESAIIYS